MTYCTFTLSEVQLNRGVPPNDGLIGVMNNTTDGTIVEIRRVWLAPQSGLSDVAGQPGRIRISRISASSGGDSISFANNDTTSTSLPSQIELRASPDSVTETSVLGYRSDVRAFGETLGNNYAVMNPSYMDPKINGSDYANLYFRGRDSAVESYTCREGEGIAFILDTLGFPKSWSLRVCVRVLSTGKCYIADAEPALIEYPRLVGLAFWSIMNNTGSGVVIEVTGIDMNEVGYTNVMPEYSLVKGACVGTNRRTLTPAAFDTNNNCPAGIVCVGAPFYLIPGAAEHGAVYDIPYYNTNATTGVPIAQQLKYGRFRHRCYLPFFQITTAPAFRFGKEEALYYEALIDNTELPEGIILRSNEGVGIVQRSSAVLNRSCLSPVQGGITFTVRPPAATAIFTNRVSIR